MQVDVKMYTNKKKENGKGSIVAYGDILINKWMMVKNVRIIEGADGLFVSFPQKKVWDDDKKFHYENLVSFSSKEQEEFVKGKVVAAYHETLMKEISMGPEESVPVKIAFDEKGPQKAIATLNIDGVLVSGFRIMQNTSEEKPYVLMPQFYSLNGDKNEFHDLIFPTNVYSRNSLINCVLNAYNLELNKVKAQDLNAQIDNARTDSSITIKDGNILRTSELEH